MAFITPGTSTDSSFEGVITYSTISNNSLAAQPNNQSSTSKFYIKGSKMKTVIGRNSTITDCSSPDNYILLMDVNGSKYNVKMDKRKQIKDPVIKYTDETKTIAGYNCHKAELTIFIDSIRSINEVVYYTTDLESSFCGHEYKGLKGFPLEWIAKFGAITRTTTAVSIDKQSLSDDEFAVPPGYKVVTQEEMSQDIQKSMGNKGK
jgi:GLPGLI family protein